MTLTARDLAFAAAGVALVIAACGTPGDAARADTPPEGYSDGTRIKARWITVVFADGAKGRTFAGWWDSERKEECVPSTLSAETTGAGWCIPTGYVAEPALFEDAACSKLLALDPIPGAKGAMVAGKLWTHGAPVTVPVTVWRQASKGVCDAAPTTWERAGIVRPVEVPMSQFAAVTITAP